MPVESAMKWLNLGNVTVSSVCYWWNVVRPLSIWAWIYYNPSQWIISASPDWTTWVSIADKNLWATTVYNTGDALSQANCWNYYQWWNNYGFPFSWATITSSTKVDVSNYWPWNYYSSPTFITEPTRWSNSNPTDFRDLWWGETWTTSARQWPCPTGWHLPTILENNNLLKSIPWFDSYLELVDWDVVAPLLKIPPEWNLEYSDGTVAYTNQVDPDNDLIWIWWWSNAVLAGTYDWRGRFVWASISTISHQFYTAEHGKGHVGYWLPIRPFKDTPAIPDTSTAWTCLYRKIS